jgi:drug/metabolite transporter (DMT)-like permease
MRFRAKILIASVLTLVALLVLWSLPGPRATIAADGMKTENTYWWWLAGGVLVALGCAFEYFWMTGFDLLNKRLSRRQKVAAGTVLLSVAVVAFSYGVFQYYRR